MRHLISFVLSVSLTTLAAANPAVLDSKSCPVVGNTNSKIYHVPGGWSYDKMLTKNRKGDDNRKCFETEDEAKEAGYRKAKR